MQRRLREARGWLILGVLAGAVAVSGAGGSLSHQDAERTWAGPLRLSVAETARPTPQDAVSATPLGLPRLAPADRGPHAFVAHQRDGTTPVAYDPCRPIPYVVNWRTAPAGADTLVDEAVARMSEVTGLRFQLEGTTDEAPTPQRAAFQPQRYGDRWAPVLIAWSDPAELPLLAGDVAGIGGSTWVEAGSSTELVYVTGMVALDGPQLGAVLAARDGQARVRGVILHELGHLLGLDHVDAPAQLMHERSRSNHLQPGDLTGLVRLGTGPCFPRL